ncbi:hypothetical protein ACIQRK_33325 [Streptomyces anulatus]
MYRAGLIHHDLKPSNVLLAEDGVRAIGFGIARATEGRTALTHAGAVPGSPPFMSPEQVHGARRRPRVTSSRSVPPCARPAPDCPTPGELLALIGALAPTTRHWPAEVHRIPAARRTEIDRLVSLPDHATASAPAPGTTPLSSSTATSRCGGPRRRLAPSGTRCEADARNIAAPRSSPCPDSAAATG